jgi:hypothetical protein
MLISEFGGTGGWLQAAETEEKYVMTWTNSRNKTAVEENIARKTHKDNLQPSCHGRKH